MPKEFIAILVLLTGESLEWYFARLLSDTTVLYRAHRCREKVERWLRGQGLG